MTTLVVLTADPTDSTYSEMWRPFFERLAAPLRAAGLTVESAPWTEPAPDADAYTPLMAWGYHKRWDDWRRFLDAMEGRRMINGVEALRWNGDKAYLTGMGDAGAPTVPTLSLDHADQTEADRAFDLFGTDALVIKPRVSAGAHHTVLLRRGETLTGGPVGPALIQPYLPAVSGEGEWSLLYFGGELSHALTKVAKPGDFRVQFQYGGVSTPAAPPPAVLKAAEAVIGTCPTSFTYGRVDLISDGAGGYMLMELELIEPHLFLDTAADHGAAFARAMKAAAEA